jgi:CHAT domain-containing protein
VSLIAGAVRGKSDEATLQRGLRELCRQVWEPVERGLPPMAKKLVLCPDDVLCHVSFATLLSEDNRFLAEKWPLRYVASGRDLVRSIGEAGAGGVAIFADPDFDATREALPVSRIVGLTRAAIAKHPRDLHFDRLPGAAREIDAVAAIARRRGLAVQTFAEDAASKAALNAVAAPWVLHLATHGFVFPEGEGALAHPMRRSLLALAGANRTLQAWARNTAPTTIDDGILTAEDVCGLDLHGTWLVTLSACDTGGGELRGGEGVMGLRRGFVQAGAENLLMTLWPINDNTTVEIMTDFYERAFASSDAPRALAETQREWLVKLREQRGLLHAVEAAGAFIMNSIGKAPKEQ